MKTKKKKDLLVNTLVSERFVAEEIVEVLQKEATEKGAHVFDLLFEKGVITHTEIGMAKANHYGVGFVRLEKLQIPDYVRRTVLPTQAHNFRIVPIENSKKGLTLATEDLLKPSESEKIMAQLGRSCEFQICATDAMDETLELYYSSGKEVGRCLREGRLAVRV